MPCPNCGGAATYVNADMHGNYAYAECRGHIQREGYAKLKKRPDEEFMRARYRIQYSKPPCGWSSGKKMARSPMKPAATVTGKVKETSKETGRLVLSDYRSG
tara:strand:+ start:42952 stop:43257 length:306 start_codon:yes stop_codon:yes gene_type:complete